MTKKQTSAKRPRHDIPDEVLDKILEQVDDPKEQLGADGLFRQLMGRLVERTLSVELTEHLGYEPGQERPTANARNGTTPKTLLTEAGKVDVRVPRDREGTFEPQLVAKHQRRLTGFDERIIALYSRGMSVREIQEFCTCQPSPITFSAAFPFVERPRKLVDQRRVSSTFQPVLNPVDPRGRADHGRHSPSHSTGDNALSNDSPGPLNHRCCRGQVPRISPQPLAQTTGRTFANRKRVALIRARWATACRVLMRRAASRR